MNHSDEARPQYMCKVSTRNGRCY